MRRILILAAVILAAVALSAAGHAHVLASPDLYFHG